MQHYIRTTTIQQQQTTSPLNFKPARLLDQQAKQAGEGAIEGSLRNGTQNLKGSDPMSPILRHNARKTKINKKVSQEGNLSKGFPGVKRYQAKKQSPAKQDVQETPAEAYDQSLQSDRGFISPAE